MTALATPPLPALVSPNIRIAPMARTAIGAILSLLGLSLLFSCFHSHDFYYAGLAVILAFIGLSQLHHATAESVGIPVVAILAAFIPFGIFVACSGANPFKVMQYLYEGSLATDRTGGDFPLQNTLLRAAPLMLTGLCTALPMRLGMVIIGGEGALGMGALASAYAAHLFQSHSPFFIITASLAAGFLAGGVWITIAGVLKQYRGVNETISSLLLIYIAMCIFRTLVEGPWRDPDSLNHPASWPIGDDNALPMMPFHGLDSVHWGLVIGIVACLLAYLLVNHTAFGFSARVIGGNIRAAKVAGLSIGKIVIIMCMCAGGAAGLAGAIEVSANLGAASDSVFGDRYGYTGILVAFLARQSPLGIIPVAILIGGIAASNGLLQSNLHLPDATVMVLQGTIFLMILASESYYGRLKIFTPLKSP